MHQKLLKKNALKQKVLKFFCKPKGIKGPKVLKVVPKLESEIPKVLIKGIKGECKCVVYF